MDNNEQKVLQGSTDYFTQHLKLKHQVLPDLIRNKVLHEVYDWEDIKFEEDDQKAIQVFVQRLCKSGPEAFEKFLSVLKENGHGFIADYLLKKLDELSLCQRGVDFPIKDFEERKAITCLIDNVLKDKGVAILTGPNGSGKTQLARRTAQSFVAANPSGFHVTLNGQSLGTLETSLQNIVNCQDLGPVKYSSDNEKIKYLLKELFKRMSAKEGRNLLNIDDVKKESFVALSEAMACRPNSVQIIMTTNDATLFQQYAISVIGFNEEEALSFFQSLSNDVFPESEVKRLCKTLSYIPLGLHVAILYINQTSCGIESYIKQLGVTLKAQPQLAAYNKTLVAAIQLMIASIRSCSQTTFLLGSCLMFLHPAKISEEFVRHVCHVLCVVGDPTIVQDPAEMVDDLVSEFRKTSLCLVSGTGPNRVFQIHEVVQLVWLKCLPRDELHSHFKAILKALVGFCSMDTRLSEHFKSLCQTHPHLESVTLYRINMDIDDTECLILYSQVCNFLGHFYKHNNQPEKAVAVVHEGLKSFFSIFPNDYAPPKEQHSLIGWFGHYLKRFFGSLWGLYTKRQVLYLELSSNLMVVQKARKVFYSSKEFAPQIACLKSYICCKRYHSHPGFQYHNTPGYITWKIYQNCVKRGYHVPVEIFQHIYLLENYMSLAYTYGRIYHYSDKTRVTPDQKAQYIFHLQVVSELGKMVLKEYGVSLSLEMLCQKYGLMYIKMEREGKTEQQYCSDLVEVKDYYLKLLKDKRKRFSMGLLSPLVDDKQFEAACLRTVVRCLRLLVECGKKVYLPELKEQMSLLEKKLDDMKGSGLFEKLDRPTSFYNEVARCHLCVGNVEKACQLFEYVIALEKESKLIPYTLNEAVQGCVDCYISQNNPQKANECIEEYNKIIKDFSSNAENNSIYNEALNICNELRKKVDSFNKVESPEITVSMSTSGSNI